MKKKSIWLLALSLVTLGGFFLSCTNDPTPPIVIDDPGDGTPDPDPDPEDPIDPEEGVTYFLPEETDDNFLLINDAQSNRVYLIDKNGTELYEWSLSNNIGNDVVLMPDGRLLASLEVDEPAIIIGGKAGQLQLIQYDGTIDWQFEYATEDYITHHDAEMLPNGNVIVMVWERKSALEAAQAGSVLGTEVFPEAVIEVNPQTDEIVWEWHAWDHLIQDADAAADNFGVVSDHPQLIDLNYVDIDNGDIMHGNGIAYDAEKDLIFLSINFYSEIWVIDHSTTTAEAASNSGGNYGKGGDLIYRFGNPEAYQNPAGTRRFYNNHHPNLLKGAHSGKMLVFGNKTENLEQSTVYEIVLPTTYQLVPGADNEPEVAWSFTHPDLYSARVSGAVLLPNSNVLITEGDFGIWEVNRNGEIVWQFERPGFFWRTYNYDQNAAEIQGIGF